MHTKIEERQKAEVKYEDAVASGKTAVIGTFTESSRDMMRILIGNLPPHSEAKLTVYFYQQLDQEDLSYKLKIPMSYFPKYAGDMVHLLTEGI
jgi:Vault protein inter-alpha-trypsin domain